MSRAELVSIVRNAGYAALAQGVPAHSAIVSLWVEVDQLDFGAGRRSVVHRLLGKGTVRFPCRRNGVLGCVAHFWASHIRDVLNRSASDLVIEGVRPAVEERS